MTKRDFLAMEDWSADALAGLLALAARIKRGEIAGGLASTRAFSSIIFSRLV